MVVAPHRLLPQLTTHNLRKQAISLSVEHNSSNSPPFEPSDRQRDRHYTTGQQQKDYKVHYYPTMKPSFCAAAVGVIAAGLASPAVKATPVTAQVWQS